MRVDERWEASVFMRVFLTIMSWSNEDDSWWEYKSESLHGSFLNYHVLVKRGWELMRVEKQEFVWEFSQLSCPGQTRMSFDESWEARVCMRVFLTIMSWSNEDESWWELRSESLHESFRNYYVLVKRGWELMRVEVRVCMRVFGTIMSWSNEDESWWELRSESLHESFRNYYVLVKRRLELMRAEERKFVRVFL